MVFCSYIFPGYETDPLLLVESVRAFGGAFSDQPLWMMTPDFGKPLSPYAVSRLREMDVRIIPFAAKREELRFFFTGELTGLAQAEALAANEYDIMVWMDANTIMVKEPSEFYLPDGIVLGYRPVQHLLVGSRFDHPLDPFWQEIYQSCNVPEESVFPMRLTVQDLYVRPYFNAGFLLLRPQAGLVRMWHDKFKALYQTPPFQPFYARDERYIIFMHQAVLAGVVLSHFKREQLRELPRGYNYPMDLFDVDHTVHRPAGMEHTVTFRHEEFYEQSDWRDHFPACEELKNWLEDQLTKIPVGG